MNAPLDSQSDTTLDAVMAPVARARGLPNAHYTCEQTFQREKAAVLFATWAGVGFAASVPNPGDALPFTFLGLPLLLLRDREGRIGVFQNTCRHRGMILVEQPRNIAGAIRCPYHSWCYDLNGALRATPHVGGPGHNTDPAIDRAELGLIRVRHHEFCGTVFVNVDGTAPPFEVVHGDLLARWAEFAQPMFHGGAGSAFTIELRANWKLAVDNYCESYHLPWVHPGLNAYSRLEDHYNIEQPGAFSGQGTRVYRQLTDGDGATLPDFAGLSDRWSTGAEYVALYPNVLLGVHRDHAFAIILDPLAVDSTVEHVALFYAAPPETLNPGLLARNAAQWKTVFEEDVFVVEGMQRGRHGILFDGGRFSPAMDGPTHMFHDWIARRVTAGR